MDRCHEILLEFMRGSDSWRHEIDMAQMNREIPFEVSTVAD